MPEMNASNAADVSLDVAPPAPARPRDRWLRLALVTFVVLAVGTFYLTGLHEQFRWEVVRSHITSWQAYARENLLLTAAIYFGIYVAFTALSLPAALVLSLVAGALFEPWVAVVVVSIASTCGASLAFLGSRYLFHDWVLRRFGNRLRVINRGVQRDGAWYLFTLRLTPVVPYFLINLGMAMTPMRWRTFAAVTWLGMLPASLIIVTAGTELGRIEKPSDALSPEVLLSLTLLGLAPLLFRLVLRWLGWLKDAEQPAA